MKTKILIVSFLIIAVCWLQVRADITLRRSVSSSMFGMPATNMTTTDQIKGDKGSLVIEYDPNDNGGEAMPNEIYITRLDKGSILALNTEPKTYDEMPLTALAEYSKMNEAALAESGGDEYQWVFDTEETVPNEINGRLCHGMIVTARGQFVKDTTEKVILTYEQWVSDDEPGYAEMVEYGKKYQAAVGIEYDKLYSVAGDMIVNYCSKYEDITAKIHEMKGLPVRTVISARMQIGEKELDEQNINEASGPRQAAAMAMYLMGRTGTDQPNSMLTLFSFTYNLLNFSTEAIDDRVFEIPEGYAAQ